MMLGRWREAALAGGAVISCRLGYTLLLYLLFPRAMWRLWRRGRREPGYREHVAERFGRYPASAPRGVLWVHAVSVGETRAAQPIVERMLARHPDKPVLLTHMTPTGRDTGVQLFGDRVLHSYLPYDYPGAVARFLDHYRPAVGLLMETEIWFNLIHACKQRRIALHLVNARLSEKSYTGYRRIRALAEQGLNELTSIASQSEADAKRFEALGARNAHVVGNVKFDIAPAREQVEVGEAWRVRWGKVRPVWLAASTREGEEALIIDQLHRIGPGDLLTVIVPRHPQRFDQVAELLDQRGISYCRRSRDDMPDTHTQVLLGDSMGELFAFYAACDVAFIGGSLRPFGGHNLLEACALAKPVIIGPSTYNFQEATELGIEAGGVVQVQDAEALAKAVTALLTNAPRRREVGAAAHAFAMAHRGAVERLFALLKL
jgi:3-deoxy-D-manno-octulosonic-acid transferase